MSVCPIEKTALLQAIVEQLQDALHTAQTAAAEARNAATHSESKAENKYDTRGLEASYLAAGQSRRVREIEEALTACQNLSLKAFGPDDPIQLGALITLEAEDGTLRHLFLGPAAAGLKVCHADQEILVITPKSPMGEALLGRHREDTVTLQAGHQTQRYDIVGVG